MEEEILANGNGQFVLPTKGYCFVCLEATNKLIASKSNLSSPSKDSHSLHRLSHYLKINFGKLVNDLVPVAQGTMSFVEKAEVRAELCKDCSLATEKFSNLYEIMEHVKMEVEEGVRVITRKLLEGDLDEFREHVGKKQNQIDAQIVEKFREEMLMKCCLKIDNSFPKIKLERLKVYMGDDDGDVIALPDPDPVPVPIPLRKLSPLSFNKGVTKKEPVPTPIPVTVEADDEEGALLGTPNLLKCPDCKRVFFNQTYLENHRRLVHQIKNPAQVKRAETVAVPPSGLDISNFQLNLPFPQDNHTQQQVKAKATSGFRKTINTQHRPAFPGVQNRPTTSLASPPPPPPVVLHPSSSVAHRCHICKKTFTTASGLKIHLESIHYRNRRATCDKCGINFAHLTGLQKHRRLSCPYRHKISSATQPPSYLQSRLQKSKLKGRSQLTISKITAQKASTFASSLPSFSGAGMQARGTPSAAFHTNYSLNLKYKCDLCKKRFLRPYMLQDHIKCFHNGERYICSVQDCRSTFLSKAALQTHCRKFHNRNIPYSLMDSVKISQQSDASPMEENNSLRKPFQQDFTITPVVTPAAIASQHRQLNATANVKKPLPRLVKFGTTRPPMAFIKRTVTTAHTSTSEFVCEICRKAFTTAKTLQTHKDSIHRGIRYKCDNCKHLFAFPSSLSRHLRKGYCHPTGSPGAAASSSLSSKGDPLAMGQSFTRNTNDTKEHQQYYGNGNFQEEEEESYENQAPAYQQELMEEDNTVDIMQQPSEHYADQFHDESQIEDEDEDNINPHDLLNVKFEEENDSQEFEAEEFTNY